jgi:hypothetical protein
MSDEFTWDRRFLVRFDERGRRRNRRNWKILLNFLREQYA